MKYTADGRRIVSSMEKGVAATHHSKRGSVGQHPEIGLGIVPKCRASGCRERLFSVDRSLDPGRPDTAIFVIRAPHLTIEEPDGSWSVILTGKAGTGYVSWERNLAELPDRLTVTCRHGHSQPVDVRALQKLTAPLLVS